MYGTGRMITRPPRSGARSRVPQLHAGCKISLAITGIEFCRWIGSFPAALLRPGADCHSGETSWNASGSSTIPREYRTTST